MCYPGSLNDPIRTDRLRRGNEGGYKNRRDPGLLDLFREHSTAARPGSSGGGQYDAGDSVCFQFVRDTLADLAAVGHGRRHACCHKIVGKYIVEEAFSFYVSQRIKRQCQAERPGDRANVDTSSRFFLYFLTTDLIKYGSRLLFSDINRQSSGICLRRETGSNNKSRHSMKWKIADLHTCLNFISVLSLLVGLGSAVWIYQTTANDSNSVLGYEEGGGSVYPVTPEDSKMFLRDLELYGGEANVIAYQFRRWLAGLWHGKSLAVMVGCITILISFGFFYAANHLPSSSESDVSGENDQDGTDSKV